MIRIEGYGKVKLTYSVHPDCPEYQRWLAMWKRADRSGHGYGATIEEALKALVEKGYNR